MDTAQMARNAGCITVGIGLWLALGVTCSWLEGYDSDCEITEEMRREAYRTAYAECDRWYESGHASREACARSYVPLALDKYCTRPTTE